MQGRLWAVTTEAGDPTSLRSIDGVDVLFAVLLALLSASVVYRFAAGNQLEQLPIVLRQLDPGYLTGDFFVSTSADFGPRLYFARLVAWICYAMPLAWAYALLTLLSDFALILVTQWTARRIVGASRQGAMIAAVLTVVVSGFHLGDATEIRYEVFQPASLAIPGMLFAIGLGWLGRPLPAAVVASASSLPHPLYGIAGGAIALATAFFTLLITPGHGSSSVGSDGRSATPLAWRTALIRTAAGAAMLGASILALWWWPSRELSASALSTNELFDILGRFRSPHHYFPSQFRPQDFVTTALFAYASWLAFREWSREVATRRAWLFLVPTLLVAVGCIAGTLFTEIWPVGAVLTLQPFRLLSVLKWTGYLMIGRLLADLWHDPPNPLARPIVFLSLLSVSGTFPLVTAAGLSLNRIWSRLPRKASPLVWIFALAASAAGLWAYFGTVDERVRLTIASILLVAFWQSSKKTRTVAALVTVSFVLALIGNGQNGLIDFSPITPIITLDDHHDVDAETARAATRESPPDALFIVPPDFGILRVIGRRALVIDFEAIPFQGQHMREWRERIRVVYGETEGGGFAARRRLQENYRRMTDARLQDLALRYGATHAVLFRDATTTLPELWSNDTYRVVRLQPSRAARIVTPSVPEERRPSGRFF